MSLPKQSESLQVRTAAISTVTVKPAIRAVCYTDSKENHFPAARQPRRAEEARACSFAGDQRHTAADPGIAGSVGNLGGEG